MLAFTHSESDVVEKIGRRIRVTFARNLCLQCRAASHSESRYPAIHKCLWTEYVTKGETDADKLFLENLNKLALVWLEGCCLLLKYKPLGEGKGQKQYPKLETLN